MAAARRASRRDPVRFGVLGARSFVASHAVMPAIATSDRAEIACVASRSGRVAERWSAFEIDSYDAVLEYPSVEAIYLPLPNGMHEEWTVRAAMAGKHVLCEKPLAPDAASARRMVEACARNDVLLAEAWMSPFGDRWRVGVERARRGDIGRVESVHGEFTFTMAPTAAGNYRWDPAQGGGALLDVGIYCIGPAVELFGASPAQVAAHVTPAASGVDATISVALDWAGGRRATARCSFVEEERQLLRIVGSSGTIELDDEPHTGGDPYRPMIDAFADAVRGDALWPRPAERSVELLELLDRIRESADTLAR